MSRLPARYTALIAQGWLSDGGVLEGRHHLRTKALELFHSDLFGYANRQTHGNPLKTWIVFFQGFEVLDNLLRRAILPIQ